MAKYWYAFECDKNCGAYVQIRTEDKVVNVLQCPLCEKLMMYRGQWPETAEERGLVQDQLPVSEEDEEHVLHSIEELAASVGGTVPGSIVTASVLSKAAEEHVGTVADYVASATRVHGPGMREAYEKAIHDALDKKLGTPNTPAP